MAIVIALFVVSLLQILTSVVSLAFCFSYFTNTTDLGILQGQTFLELASVTLPSFSLLVCGVIGILTSVIHNATAVVVHTTATSQTAVWLAIIIWHHSRYEGREKCLISTIFCLIVCLFYIVYKITSLFSTKCYGSTTLQDKDLESARDKETTGEE